MKRRSFLAKILGSAVAAPAVAGIIARGNGAPLIRAGSHDGEIFYKDVRYLREYTATEVHPFSKGWFIDGQRFWPDRTPLHFELPTKSPAPS